jgi:hypothetical protein
MVTQPSVVEWGVQTPSDIGFEARQQIEVGRRGSVILVATADSERGGQCKVQTAAEGDDGGCRSGWRYQERMVAEGADSS